MFRKRRINKKRGKRVGVTGRTNAVLDRVARVTFRECPLVVAQTSSVQTGCLSTTSSSLASLTAVKSVTVDPFLLGGRVGQIADQFTQWRPRYVKVTYYPEVAVGGAEDTVNGNGTVNYANRSFCIGFTSDVSLAPANFIGAIELGGQPRSTDRICSVTAPRKRQWYFCTTTSSTPSLVDLRMSCPFLFYGFFAASSTTNSLTYGTLVFDMELEFRGTSNATVIGVHRRISEEKKEDDTPPVVIDTDEIALCEAIRKCNSNALGCVPGRPKVTLAPSGASKK